MLRVQCATPLSWCMWPIKLNSQQICFHNTVILLWGLVERCCPLGVMLSLLACSISFSINNNGVFPLAVFIVFAVLVLFGFSKQDHLPLYFSTIDWILMLTIIEKVSRQIGDFVTHLCFLTLDDSAWVGNIYLTSVSEWRGWRTRENERTRSTLDIILDFFIIPTLRFFITNNFV